MGLAPLLGACGGGSDSGGTTPPVVACPSGALPNGAADTTFSVAAWPDRDYDLVLPASHVCGTPIGVVIAYHGGGGNKENMRTLTCPGGDISNSDCLFRVAIAAGLAVVLPNGTNAVGGKLINPNGVRTWDGGGGQNGTVCVSGAACQKGIDDVGYTRALLADVGTHIAIDPKRVFGTGFSDGAAMTQRLGCEAADIFAAIAPVSGENQFSTSGCAALRPVAVLDIHGTADRCWPYDGGQGGCIETGRYVSVDFTLSGWAMRNGCNPVATMMTLPPLPGVSDGTSVVEHDYSGCVVGGALEHLEVVGNGHYWPSGKAYASGAILGGLMSRQLDTSQAVVAFFLANARP